MPSISFGTKIAMPSKLHAHQRDFCQHPGRVSICPSTKSGTRILSLPAESGENANNKGAGHQPVTSDVPALVASEQIQRAVALEEHRAKHYPLLLHEPSIKSSKGCRCSLCLSSFVSAESLTGNQGEFISSSNLVGQGPR
jgi:hypothetical protein